MKYVLFSLALFVIGLTGLLNPLKNFTLFFLTPVQFGLSKVGNGIKQGTQFFASAGSVRDENLSLRNRIYDLEQQVEGLKWISDENTLLKQQLQLTKDIPQDYDNVMADIMVDITDLAGNTIVLNKGTRSGVKAGDMVVVGKYLIGVVRSVNYTFSHVELVTSPNLATTAYDIDQPQKTSGLVSGKHGADFSMERILPTEEIKIGDTIVTSGKDGIFRPGFIIGKVAAVQDDPLQPLKKADLKTVIDFQKLVNVFILISKQ